MNSVKLSHNVYRRTSPTVNSQANGYASSGSSLVVKDVVIGGELEGNSIWYQGTDHYYYWSGGIQDVEFTLLNSDFSLLRYDQQRALCMQAQQYYGPKLRAIYPELTGLAVNQKESGRQIQERCSLLFYVQEKLEQPVLHFPASLPFRGFLIPTDVRNSAPVALCGIGQIVGKPGVSMGTAGFIGVDNANQCYLVTGYHVLCADRLQNDKKSLLENDTEYDNQRVIADAAGTLGTLLNGTIDAFNDSVKTRLSRQESNIFTNGTALAGFIPRSELSDLVASPTKVVMTGAITGIPKEGSIVNLNRDLDIPVIKHSFFKLIEIDIPAQHGDSGAPVYTLGSNRLVGIVTATNFVDRTYVIPIEVIFRRLGLTNVAP